MIGSIAALTGRVHSDAALRMSDILNEAVLTPGACGRVIAIRLADGGSDRVLYDTRRDAIAHQALEQLCDYVVIKPTAYSPADCQARLDYTRAMYDAGWRWDLDGPAPAMPVRAEDLAVKTTQLRQHARRS
ncbi:MAG: hypothetical protein ACYCVZ_17100 [Streptosporangiaceae bacterium]